MKLTIATTELEKLVKGVFARVPPKTAVLTITACNGKLVLQSGGGGAATAADVSSPGEVTLPAKTFRQVLDTYKGTPKLTLESNGLGLKINSFTLPVSSWNPAPKMPEGF